MKGDVYLNQKESRRLYVMEQVLAGRITTKEAAQLLGLSQRHIKRLKGGMKQDGVAFLAHKNRGRKPAHAIPDHTKQTVLELATTLYTHTSCQHISELLAQYHAINISAKSVSRILKAAGIPLHHPRKSPRRRRTRDRMPQEGLLVQIDASPYKWLDDRAPALSLHGAIDDATGKILGLYFLEQEQTIGYFHVLQQVLLNHGIPNSIYTDRHSIFFSPKRAKLTIEQELSGEQIALTQFGQALSQLGITHIPAHSPQAKGRIERLWATLQSRLPVELRLAGISTIDEANRFLPDFIQRFNDRFAVKPADPTSAFKPAPPISEFTHILAFKSTRLTSKGSTISYFGRTYQLVDDKGSKLALPARYPITVLECMDGKLRAQYQSTIYDLRIQLTPMKTTEKPAAKSSTERKPNIPGPDHPWRHFKLYQQPTLKQIHEIAARR